MPKHILLVVALFGAGCALKPAALVGRTASAPDVRYDCEAAATTLEGRLTARPDGFRWTYVIANGLTAIWSAPSQPVEGAGGRMEQSSLTIMYARHYDRRASIAQSPDGTWSGDLIVELSAGDRSLRGADVTALSVYFPNAELRGLLAGEENVRVVLALRDGGGVLQSGWITRDMLESVEAEFRELAAELEEMQADPPARCTAQDATGVVAM